jgi:hypothetical protein
MSSEGSPDQPESINRVILSEDFRGESGNIGFSIAVNQIKVGSIELQCHPDLGEVEIDLIFIQDTYVHQGYGSQVYRIISQLPLLEGKSLVEAGFKFVSSVDQSTEITGIWESLTREGLAQKMNDGRYEYTGGPPPAET